MSARGLNGDTREVRSVSKKVLIVDDEPNIVAALEFLLERMKRTKTNKEFFATMAQ